MAENMIPPLALLTHGVYVIGVSSPDRKNAFTAAWVMQSSFDPPMLALSINPAHSSYPILIAGGYFTVNFLRDSQKDLALHFGTPRKEQKLATVSWHESRCGAPILDAALAWFECEVVNTFPSGDHILVLGNIINAKSQDAEGSPLVYRQVSDDDPSNKVLPSHTNPCASSRETS